MKQFTSLIIFLISYNAFSLVKPNQDKIINYNYELNVAPAAFFAHWLSADLIKYDQANTLEKYGYGIAINSFGRNRNSFDGLLPSREGFSVGLVGIIDSKESYISSHVYYEKYDRISYNSTIVQEREGFNGNIVIGGKEFFLRKYAVKFGIGFEVMVHKIREYNDLNKFVQNNYTSVQLNPLFLELRLAGLF